MSRLVPLDQQERDKIYTKFGKNFTIQAGAGSGKTTCLVSRMVNQLKFTDAVVEEIVAITFTKKAAEELRGRFQNHLEKEIRVVADPNEREKLSKALMDINQCFLGTIHSFCGKMLREMPIEAKLNFEFKELDEEANNEFLEKVWNQFITEEAQVYSDLLEKISETHISIKDLKETFINLSEYTDVELVRRQCDKVENLEELLFKVNAIYPKLQAGFSSAKACLENIDKFKNFKSLNDIEDSDFNKIQAIKFFSKISIGKKFWKSVSNAEELQQEYEELTSQCSSAISKWQKYHYCYTIEFLQRALEYAQKKRQEYSLLNFQDLLSKTRDMLKNSKVARQYFKGKYKYLYIDEFQDTDPIQAEIMFYLTGTDENEEDWRKIVPLPGSLFIVGDPKQAIYRFRRADIDTYNWVRKRICESGGEELLLTSNFRSVKKLCYSYNNIFKILLPEIESKYQAQYSAANKVREDLAGTEFGVKFLRIPEQYCDNSDKILQVDTNLISEYISNALKNGMKISVYDKKLDKEVEKRVEEKDFMILTYNTKYMNLYAQALQKNNIPCIMSGGSSLNESYEINELYKVVRFLADVNNELALAAVLRGDFFGISDQALYDYRRDDKSDTLRRFSIFIDETEFFGLKEEYKESYLNAVNKLKKYYRWSKSCTPVSALERIIEDLGLIPLVLSEKGVNNRCNYIYQLLEILRQGELDGSIYDFTTLEMQYRNALESKISNELSLKGEENAVRIMNLHKAKGLEAPIVILAKPTGGREHNAVYHIERQDNGLPKGYFDITKNYQGTMITLLSCNYYDKLEEENKFLNSERIRLLYVAVTRAKNLLVISSCEKPYGRSPNPWQPLIDNFSINEDNIVKLINNEDKKDVAVTEEEKLEELEKIFTDAQSNYKLWKEQMSKESYHIVSPSELNTGTETNLISKGRGPLWGTIIHQVFKTYIDGDMPFDDNILKALEDNIDMDNLKSKEIVLLKLKNIKHSSNEDLKTRIYEELAQDIKKVVEKFSASELFFRVKNAEYKFTEFPFSFKLDTGDSLYVELKSDSSAGGVLVSGNIDLVFKEADGWVIVDYKTDGVEDTEELAKIYKNQLQAYQKVWERISGEKVKELLIYSEYLNSCVSLNNNL